MLPMDLTWRLLKRQTQLGEHPGFEDEAFSSHGPVTHYHATKAPEDAESIKRHGIRPAGNYATHSGGKTKSIYSYLVNDMDSENTEPLIWATGEGQELPTEYAGTYNDKWVGEPQFDESGMLIPGTGPSREREFQEGGMFGIRGGDIDWERSQSPIYRQGEEFYIHNQPIPREKIIPMPVQTGEPMDIAMRLLKRQTELGEFHPDLPSSHGPVKYYHGTPETNVQQIMRQGLKAGTPSYETLEELVQAQKDGSYDKFMESYHPNFQGAFVTTKPERAYRYGEKKGNQYRPIPAPALIGVREGAGMPEEYLGYGDGEDTRRLFPDDYRYMDDVDPKFLTQIKEGM